MTYVCCQSFITVSTVSLRLITHSHRPGTISWSSCNRQYQKGRAISTLYCRMSWHTLMYTTRDWYNLQSSSSRMRVIYHNWSATKQRPHPQSVAEISHSVLSGDRIRQCETSSGSRHKDTDQCLIVAISFCRHRSVPSVRKRFSRDHCCRGRSKFGCRIVGSHTRWELTTLADFQLCLHRLLMSTGCKSSQSGFLDVSRSNGGLSISGWIGQLSCLTIFSTSLSVAAFLRRAGGSMLQYYYID